MHCVIINIRKIDGIKKSSMFFFSSLQRFSFAERLINKNYIRNIPITINYDLHCNIQPLISASTNISELFPANKT